MSRDYLPPKSITIRSPVPIPRARGLNATGELYGRNMKVRVTISERHLIDEVAEALGMSVAAYIRWCSVQCARALVDDIREGTTNKQ